VAIDDRGRLAGEVDRIVARADADAVRRHRQQMNDREVSIWESDSGMGEVYGKCFATDAEALDKRLDALAATVCAADPRTRDQRRADALGALATGADRLGCRCGTGGRCAGKRPADPVVIHVVAEQVTLEGRSATPGSVLGADGLIPPQAVAELAKSAKLRPLLPPAGAEPRYTPSAKLAAFVRARDLTCRAPGCDRVAIECDLDHTIPYADGGATHASNLKCVCRIQDGPMTFCRGLVSAAKHSVFGAGFPAEDSVSASSATAGFVEALDVTAHGFDFGPRATISAATSATGMLDCWEALVSTSNAWRASTPNRSTIMPLA